MRTFKAQPPVDMPSDTVCVVLHVPNSPVWLSAFWWILNQYNYWYNWRETSDKRGKLVAHRWREMFWRAFDENANGQDCKNLIPVGVGIHLERSTSMDIRKNPDNECIIQMWCIDHWEDWYDPRSCITGGATQPAPGGDIAVGECMDYDVALFGNAKWILPVALDDGYKIIISGAQGGWNDGGVGWHCPNGFTYALGLCTSADPANPGDPLQTVNHMRLIAEYDGNFYDAYNQTITIIGGTGPTNLTFQANDADISNNSGSINFHVQVCNPASETFVHEFDFTASSHGWVIEGAGAHGNYIAGVGFQSEYFAADPQGILNVYREFDTRTVTRIITEYYRSSSGLASSGTHAIFAILGATVEASNVQPLGPGSITDDWTLSESIDRIEFNHRIDVPNATGVTLSKITVYGVGSDPF